MSKTKIYVGGGSCRGLCEVLSSYLTGELRHAVPWPRLDRGNTQSVTVSPGRAVVLAVRRWLPTAAARAACGGGGGVVVDKAVLEQVFSGYFGFSRPLS
jgi:hypothetical protein